MVRMSRGPVREVSFWRVVPRSLGLAYAYVIFGVIATLALVATLVLDFTGQLGHLSNTTLVLNVFVAVVVAAFAVRSYNGLRLLRRQRARQG